MKSKRWSHCKKSWVVLVSNNRNWDVTCRRNRQFVAWELTTDVKNENQMGGGGGLGHAHAGVGAVTRGKARQGFSLVRLFRPPMRPPSTVFWDGSRFGRVYRLLKNWWLRGRLNWTYGTEWNLFTGLRLRRGLSRSKDDSTTQPLEWKGWRRNKGGREGVDGKPRSRKTASACATEFAARREEWRTNTAPSWILWPTTLAIQCWVPRSQLGK